MLSLLSSLAYQYCCKCTMVQLYTEETIFFPPAFWFRPVITDKLYHVRHTTMKIILQLRNVSVE